MKSIFLIKSPLQFLNAVEAKNHFGIDSNDCILIFMGDRKNKYQLLRLLEREHRWGAVFFLQDVNLFPSPIILQPSIPNMSLVGNDHKLFRNELYSIWKIRRICGLLQNANIVFIGDLGNLLMRHFANCLPHKKTVILDDGSATLQYCSNRHKISMANATIGKHIKLVLKTFFLGLRAKEPPHVDFFTVYRLKVPDGDGYIENDYSVLQGYARTNNVVIDDVYFLGGPLTEAGILSEKEYLWHLKRVREYFATRRVLYVAHRREKPEKLDKIETRTGLRIRYFEFPIEYQLALVGAKPAILASFFSSALITCQRIFQELLPIISFRLHPLHFANTNNQTGFNVRKVYEHYECLTNDFFHVVNLEYR